MRKLILKMSVSVDGFAGRTDGSVDWILNTTDEAVSAWIIDTISKAGAHLMGSQTFSDMISYWPYSTEEMAGPMNEIPKIVFSKKGAVDPSKTSGALTYANELMERKGLRDKTIAGPGKSWLDAEILSDDLVTEINRLKQLPGKNLLAHGGARFVQSLVKHNLIDEYRLLIHPVALGQGLPLFSRLEKSMPLELIATESFTSGVVAHIYRPIV